jgi:peptide deformylase
MSTLEIIKYPAPILRERARPFERVDDDVRRLLANMLETMYEAPGIGLAAPQVGVSRRALVMDIARDEAPKAPVFMINPQIVARGDEVRVHEEGCLSLPELFAEVERPASCRVHYLDEHGRQHEMVCEGLLSTVVQHEIDHLDGVLFVDHLSRLKRHVLIKRFLKAQRAGEAV